MLCYFEFDCFKVSFAIYSKRISCRDLQYILIFLFCKISKMIVNSKENSSLSFDKDFKCEIIFSS